MIKPPKTQNELTTLIGERKRFNSKISREQKNLDEKQYIRRSI